MAANIKQRLSDVLGDAQKTNDVYAFGDSDAKQHIIYFPGDIQNYPENMTGECAKYVEWNIENSAALLHKKFPSSLVFVIKAKKMLDNIYAAYSNFIIFDESGCPYHTPGNGAIKHMAALYKSACERVSVGCSHTSSEDRDDAETSGSVSKGDDVSSSNKLPVKIVCFSKGCTILTQMVFELPPSEQWEHLAIDVQHFLSQISDLYWLDGGHGGGEDGTQGLNPDQPAWPTALRHIEALVGLNCCIHVHVSPYQIQDPKREWVGDQYRKFWKLLQDSGAKLHGRVHYREEAPCLIKHFKLFEEF